MPIIMDRLVARIGEWFLNKNAYRILVPEWGSQLFYDTLLWTQPKIINATPMSL